MSDVKRASLEELKDFANKVREAGGGNPIDALMPAVPSNPTECLIAKNLNFNCRVGGSQINQSAAFNVDPWEESEPDVEEDGTGWYMSLEDKEIRDRIAEALDLKTHDWLGIKTYEYGLAAAIVYKDYYAVELPPHIAQVAADFDKAHSVLQYGFVYDEIYNDSNLEYTYSNVRWDEEIPEKDRELAREMIPYIKESVLEVHDLGIVKDGKLIL